VDIDKSVLNDHSRRINEAITLLPFCRYRGSLPLSSSNLGDGIVI